MLDEIAAPIAPRLQPQSLLKQNPAGRPPVNSIFAPPIGRGMRGLFGFCRICAVVDGLRKTPAREALPQLDRTDLGAGGHGLINIVPELGSLTLATEEQSDDIPASRFDSLDRAGA